jgi:quinol monooxygenase YgiN
MIIVTLRMVVKPEERENLLQIVRLILEPTRVEKGCLNYRCYQDVEDENAFVILERWQTQQDLERFIQSKNYQQLLTAMELLTEAPEIKINGISYTAGLEAIEKARGDVEEHGRRRYYE